MSEPERCAESRRHLLEVFNAALLAVNGRTRVREYLAAHPVATPLYLIAIGKAAGAMAAGAHDALGEAIKGALVITKVGYSEPLPWPVFEAAHPIPDQTSLEAGARLLRFIADTPSEANVLVLLSGGASALVECLPSGVTLAELQALTEWLLASGRDIAASNRLRTRLSLIKGGRLATRLSPRHVLCLAISDVPHDDLRFIGSGPLVAGTEPTAADLSGLPAAVAAVFDRAPPLPTPHDACFKDVSLRIIAQLDDAKRAAARCVEQLGYHAHVDPTFIAGDTVLAGQTLAQRLVKSPAGVVHIWGGETTMNLPPQPGRGGRNQSLALAAAMVLHGKNCALFLACGTDGTDGPTLDAGALVDNKTIERAHEAGYNEERALARADAGTLLAASGDLIHTGPTGTNVMDLMMGLKL